MLATLFGIGFARVPEPSRNRRSPAIGCSHVTFTPVTPATELPAYVSVVSTCDQTSSFAAYVAEARAAPAGVVDGVVSSLLSQFQEDMSTPPVSIENSADVSTDPG